MALGAQVGHVVTSHASPEGFLIYTASPENVKNRPKRGYPYFDHFLGRFHLSMDPPPRLGLLDVAGVRIWGFENPMDVRK